MMRKMLLAGAALMMGTTAQAGEPGELGCIAKGYTAEQRTELDGLLPKVDFLGGSADDPAMEAFAQIVFASVTSCGEKFSWGDAELEPAMLHEIGRLIEVGFRRHGPFKAEQIAKIDATLAKGDRSALWKALEEQFSIGMSDSDVSVSDENAVVFGQFMDETGLGLDEKTAEQVGVYLAAKVMQRASARNFAAQN